MVILRMFGFTHTYSVGRPRDPIVLFCAPESIFVVWAYPGAVGAQLHGARVGDSYVTFVLMLWAQ